MSLETLETFDQSDKKEKDKHDIVMSGQFRAVAVFLFKRPAGGFEPVVKSLQKRFFYWKPLRPS